MGFLVRGSWCPKNHVRQFLDHSLLAISVVYCSDTIVNLWAFWGHLRRHMGAAVASYFILPGFLANVWLDKWLTGSLLTGFLVNWPTLESCQDSWPNLGFCLDSWPTFDCLTGRLVLPNDFWFQETLRKYELSFIHFPRRLYSQQFVTCFCEVQICLQRGMRITLCTLILELFA